jgi:hypothetical protein
MDSTVGELRWLVKKYRPQLLFLSETKMRGDKAKNFMWSLGYNYSSDARRRYKIADIAT